MRGEEQILQIAKQVETDHYVAIINMQRMRGVPRDIAQMRANIREEIKLGLKGYVILGAPAATKSFAKLLSPLTTLPFSNYKFANSLEEAILLARELLQKE
ncbi:MAG: hypothetical protein SH821_00485 [Phototrophicales bacterium]|nr:hypothetical protein [Phototrophicales bacterium]